MLFIVTTIPAITASAVKALSGSIAYKPVW